MASQTVSDANQLRSAIQQALPNDVITLASSGSPFAPPPGGRPGAAPTLNKVPPRSPGGNYIISGQRSSGSGTALNNSKTILDTVPGMVDSDVGSPRSILNLTFAYTGPSGKANNVPLFHIGETHVRNLTFSNVKFTGALNGWNGNGNLYM